MSEMVIVTRHAGLVEWLAQRGITGRVVERATGDDVAGEHVVGVLPLHLAALAASITTVDMPLLPLLRGKDLAAGAMDAAGATLGRYQVSRVHPLVAPTPDVLWTRAVEAAGLVAEVRGFGYDSMVFRARKADGTLTAEHWYGR